MLAIVKDPIKLITFMMNSQPRSQGLLQEWFCFYRFFYLFTRPMFFDTCSGNFKKRIKIKRKTLITGVTKKAFE